MSIIEVQATRTQKSNEEIQGREKYALKNSDSNSGTPIYVGSMILALVMYLKSSLVTPAKAAAAPPENQDRDKESVDQLLGPDSAEISSNSTKRAQNTPRPEDIDGSEDTRGGNASSEQPGNSFGFFENDGPASVHYVVPRHQGIMSTGVPVSFAVFPSNDNRTTFIADGVNGSSIAQSAGGDEVAKVSESNAAGDLPTPNRRPVTAQQVVLYDQFACLAVMIALNDLLRGASDPDGDRLQIRNATVSSGELVLVENGYRFHGEDTGPVTITYQVSDGQFEVMQTATFNVLVKPPIVGTSASDNLAGTSCDDNILGGAGNDQIDGRDGDDRINAGAGDDYVVGGVGDDVIFGQDGNDTIYGGLGNDTLSGGSGQDRLFGGAGNDLINGDSGDDLLVGDAGNDVLLGGAGVDQIQDGEGSDRVDGEAGDDTIVAAADADNDIFNGGSGIDRLDYSASSSNLTFDLAAKTVTGTDVGVDQIADIEIFVGGQANDHFSAANDAESSLVTNTSQSFQGGTGIDTLDYSHSTGAVNVDTLNAVVTGETIGTDMFSGIEQFIGSAGDDRFIVGQGSVTLDGRGGNDMFEFLTSASIASNSHSSHYIVGFDPGDWVRMSRYDIFEEAIDSLENYFDEMNGTSTGNSSNNPIADEVVPIRIRHEVSDNVARTYIDADFDNDSVYEISIQLEGDHNLLIITNNVA